MSIGSKIFRPEGVRLCGVDGNPCPGRALRFLEVEELRFAVRRVEALRVDDDLRVVAFRAIIFLL